MKLGAQLYSVRTFLTEPEQMRETFKKIKSIGYENVQLSGNAPMPAEVIRDISEESGLPIVCTHSPFDRIVGDTEALIADHKTFGCPVIGLGIMPRPYRETYEDFERFLKDLETPVKKILDAGLHFAYHNHALEFKEYDGRLIYDMMLERCEGWQFIMDTYWVEFAGHSATEYIKKLGRERLVNIHFKDIAKDEARSICACGEGTLDFEKIYKVCAEVGVRNVLVEQDTAVDKDDPFGQMKISFDHLRPIVK